MRLDGPVMGTEQISSLDIETIIENTLIHNPDLELSYVSVDVMELKRAQDFELVISITCPLEFVISIIR